MPIAKSISELVVSISMLCYQLITKTHQYFKKVIWNRNDSNCGKHHISIRYLVNFRTTIVYFLHLNKKSRVYTESSCNTEEHIFDEKESSEVL